MLAREVVFWYPALLVILWYFGFLVFCFPEGTLAPWHHGRESRVRSLQGSRIPEYQNTDYHRVPRRAEYHKYQSGNPKRGATPGAGLGLDVGDCRVRAKGLIMHLTWRFSMSTGKHIHTNIYWKPLALVM